MTPRLSPRQCQVLAFSIAHFRKNGIPPTQREIMKHLNVSSLRSAQDHLDALARKGYIRKDKRTPGFAILRNVDAQEVRINFIPTGDPE